jgi:diguanylate cyclase (GGDEF)-like protein
MTIAKKIFFGYGLLLILIFFHLLYSLTSFDEMKGINDAVAKVDNPLHELARQFIDNQLGQEFYSERILILKDKDSFDLLEKRNRDFDSLLKKIEAFSGTFASVRDLSAKGADFRLLISKNYGSMESALALTREQRELISEKRRELINIAETIRAEAQDDQNRRIELSSEIGNRAYWVLLVFGIGSVLIAVGITFLFAISISRSVGLLKLSTRQISESRFKDVRYLESKDEFGEVSRSIAEMARKIEHLEKLYLATNPLTMLPGGLAIDDTIKNRLDAGVPTALCIVDLDNFKAFNDRYGYAKGNDVIQATAMIIKEVAKEWGGEDDFIGHIGGDDFVVVTSPGKYEGISKAIIKSFDSKILQYYDQEDRRRGAIVGKNRQGAEIVFPLMTISIAVATDQGGSIKEPHILSRRAAELKEHAKSMAGSVFVVDKRSYREEEGR